MVITLDPATCHGRIQEERTGQALTMIMVNIKILQYRIVTRFMRFSVNHKIVEERRRSQSSGIGIGGGNIGGNNSQYADNHQLFLGNLPHSATEDDLRELFSQFGNIVELRIHSKSGNKVQPGVRVPPNYGFITYEDQVSVQNCLVAKVNKILFL